MAKFLTLPVELILHILEILKPHNLHYTVQACKYLRDLTIPIFYREIWLKDEVQLTLFFRTLMKNSAWINYIRSIKLVIKVDVSDHKEPSFVDLEDENERQKRKLVLLEPFIQQIWKKMGALSMELGCTQLMQDGIASGSRVLHGVLLLMVCKKLEFVYIDTESASAFPVFLEEVMTSGNFLVNLKHYEHRDHDDEPVETSWVTSSQLLKSPGILTTQSSK